MKTSEVKLKVSQERIVDMFVGACEGGSNYWCKAVTPKGEGDAYEAMLEGFSATDMQAKCGGKVYVITPIEIKKAVELMESKEERHFLDMVNEYDDAITADVFFQLCVFGEVIYG